MKINKKKSIEKINFLISFAIKEYKNNTNNPYTKDYIESALRLSKKINYRLPKQIHQKICKNCFAIRDPSNTIYRLENRKIFGKINKYLKIHCKKCDYIKKIRIK